MARFAFALLLALRAAVFGEVVVPELTSHVVDLSGALGEGRRSALDGKLAAFEARKGSQIAVLILPTTGGEPIEKFSLRVAEKWMLGRKKIDDGAFLIVALQDRVMRIEVGYGLEGALSDIVSKRIVSDVITPYFKAGDIPGGIEAGAEAMLKVVDGEPLPAPQPSAQPEGKFFGRGPSEGTLIFVFFAALVGGSILRGIFGRLGGGFLTGGGTGLLAWLVLGSLGLGIIAAILSFLFVLLGNNSMGGRRYGSRGGWGGFGGGLGGGSWGGGGGGGFSGGGGSFGGGGASGRW